MACKPAQRVKKGEVLFEIDSRTYTLERQKAEAEVRRLRSRLRGLAAQGTAIDRGKVGASENMARVQAEHEEAESVLQGAQATLDLASLKLDATKVTAPLDGVVIRVDEPSPIDLRDEQENRRNLRRLVQPQQPIPDPGGSQPDRWVRSAAGEPRGPVVRLGVPIDQGSTQGKSAVLI